MAGPLAAISGVVLPPPRYHAAGPEITVRPAPVADNLLSMHGVDSKQESPGRPYEISFNAVPNNCLIFVHDDLMGEEIWKQRCLL
jgi:hypothetical protein